MKAIKALSTLKTGPFPTYPGKNIIDEFRAWVRDTGRPDTWRYHSTSHPPRTEPYEVIADFGVPPKLRTVVGKASCPICSPSAPKYFEGALAWFPSEGVLRAIGHDCAESHFGTALANAAIAAKKKREAVEQAQDYLIEVLPKIGAMRDSMEELERIAGEVDLLLEAIRRRASKAACNNLARLGARGTLTIETTQEVSVTDRFGVESTRHETRHVASYNVAGLAFLRRRFLVKSLARNTATALKRVNPLTEEQALEFVIELESKNLQYLFDAEKLTSGVIREYEKLKEAIAEARLFFSPENMNALTDWSKHRLSNAPVIFSYNGQSRVHVRAPRKEGADIPIPMSMR